MIVNDSMLMSIQQVTKAQQEEKGDKTAPQHQLLGVPIIAITV